MNSQYSQQQLFSWVDQLTLQEDYHTLTNCFLHLLQQLSEVGDALAFEVYAGKNRSISEAASTCEQLVRRFPIDLTEESDEEHNELLTELNNDRDLLPSGYTSNGCFTRLVAAIRDVAGPNRVILLKGHFTLSNLEWLEGIIRVYRNLVALHDSKERDTLTKLPNRQTFDRRLMQICEYYLSLPRISVDSKSSWFAIMDIDHFKKVNDTFGHLYGDEVLLIFSQLMEKHFRYNDFLFRFGGEEFVVILNLANQSNAEMVFQRFREAVATHAFPTVGRVTVSIGVTHINTAVMPSTLIDRADKALYFAKANGRNQVILYETTLQASDNPDDNLGQLDIF